MTKVIFIECCSDCPYATWYPNVYPSKSIGGIYKCPLLEHGIIENLDAYPPADCPLETYYSD